MTTKHYRLSVWRISHVSKDAVNCTVNKCLQTDSEYNMDRKITNVELWRIAHRKSIENQIRRRVWNWIGHTLRKERGATEKTALNWNPQGYRKRGRLKGTWRRAIEGEIRSTRRSWNVFKGTAGDRNEWEIFMNVLWCTKSEWIWWWCVIRYEREDTENQRCPFFPRTRQAF